ncbi:MAG: hypothetical protein NVS2B15_14320 [Pseudarthrobacter sp.]
MGRHASLPGEEPELPEFPGIEREAAPGMIRLDLRPALREDLVRRNFKMGPYRFTGHVKQSDAHKKRQGKHHGVLTKTVPSTLQRHN